MEYIAVSWVTVINKMSKLIYGDKEDEEDIN